MLIHSLIGVEPPLDISFILLITFTSLPIWVTFLLVFILLTQTKILYYCIAIQHITFKTHLPFFVFVSITHSPHSLFLLTYTHHDTHILLILQIPHILHVLHTHTTHSTHTTHTTSYNGRNRHSVSLFPSRTTLDISSISSAFFNPLAALSRPKRRPNCSHTYTTPHHTTAHPQIYPLLLNSLHQWRSPHQPSSPRRKGPP